jgi:hypothetical protein
MFSSTELVLNDIVFALMQKEEKEERYCKQHSKAGILLPVDAIFCSIESITNAAFCSGYDTPSLPPSIIKVFWEAIL